MPGWGSPDGTFATPPTFVTPVIEVKVEAPPATPTVPAAAIAPNAMIDETDVSNSSLSEWELWFYRIYKSENS